MLETEVTHGRYDSIPFLAQKKGWWIFGLRGLVAIIFGTIALFIPIPAALVMTIIFGASIIIDGIFCLTMGLSFLKMDRQKNLFIISNVLSIIIGLLILFVPTVAALGLADFLWVMFALWFLMMGIFEIITVVQLPREVRDRGLLALRGILFLISSISMFLMLWINPVISLVTFGWLIGANYLVSGILLIALAFKQANRQKTDFYK